MAIDFSRRQSRGKVFYQIFYLFLVIFLKWISFSSLGQFSCTLKRWVLFYCFRVLPKLLLLRFYTFTLTKWGLRRGGLSHPTRISVTQISTHSHSFSSLSVSHSILFHTIYDMAVSTGLITSTTFLSGEASSLAKPPFTSSSLRFAYPNFPANLRMVRSPTLAAVSKQATTTPREPRGIMKPRKVSPEMEALVGVPEISRTQALKLIWAHIKGNNLQVYPDFFLKFQFLSILCVSCWFFENPFGLLGFCFKENVWIRLCQCVSSVRLRCCCRWTWLLCVCCILFLDKVVMA